MGLAPAAYDYRKQAKITPGESAKQRCLQNIFLACAGVSSVAILCVHLYINTLPQPTTAITVTDTACLAPK